MHEAVVRAIDVGFGNTKFISNAGGGKMECAHFPSLAFYSHGEPARDALGGRRRTVCVPVGGLTYEVGPEVELAADRFRSRQQHDGYTETPEYRALTAGALHFMKLDAIDVLVLGLPVAQFHAKRAALERQFTGAIDVGRGKMVTVRKVVVVAQPQGALFSFAEQHSAFGSLEGRNLVVDVGARTFDWLVTRGYQVVGKLSHSVNRGVSDVLRLLAMSVGAEIGEDFQDLEAIDRALRSGKGLRLYQKTHDLKQYDRLVQKLTDEAVASLVERLGSTHDIEHIVLVGGGASLFRKAMRRRFPRHTLLEVADPLHANVRGFQLIGERYARERPDRASPPPEPVVVDAGDGQPAA